MEFASRLRWIIVIALAITFLALIGWGLFSIANNIFRGAGTGTTEEISTYDVTSAATARFTVDGPVVANEEHRSYTIEVSQNVVSMKLFGAYGRETIEERSYRNTQEAFDTFLSALENERVTDRARGTVAEDDDAEVGVCSNGRRFIVELDNEIRRWSTSCRDNEGTAGFTMSRIRTLFQKQVPDFREITRGSGL